MDRYLTLTIAGGLACLPFICLAVWMALRLTIYKECPSSTIMVIHRKNKPDRIVKYIIRGSAPVIPLIHDCSYITLPAVSFPINLKDVPAHDNVHITMCIAFGVKFSKDDSYLKNAVNSLFGKSTNEIREKINKIIHEQLLFSIASFSAEEIFSDMKKFKTRIRSDMDQSLRKIGLVTTEMNLIDITDDAEYYLKVARKAAQKAVDQARADFAHGEEAESPQDADS